MLPTAANADTNDRIRRLPLWTGAIDIAPLKGGLSNESFLVTDGGSRHVVRIGSDFPFHHVSREREAAMARAAHEAGFAPAVHYAEPGLMVTHYIGAKTFDAEDVRRERLRIAALLRAFHTAMPSHVSGPGFLFWPFHVIRDYGRTLIADRSRHAGQVASYVVVADALETQQVGLPIVFGHNDLLPANILDDGSRLWLIDFEYAGFGTAMFDLAGAASNAGFSDAEAGDFLRAYFQSEPTPALERAFSAMQCASLLREAMWSMVSEIHLTAPGADYAAYTLDNLARFSQALERHRTRHGTA